MTTGRIAVGGVPAISISLHVPSIGPWWADCILETASDVSGRVSIEIGDTWTLSGTAIVTGTFAEQRLVRVVAGAGAWGTLLAASAYHSDGGVSARRVATDAAETVGEVIGTFAPTRPTIENDYVRIAGPAVRALEDVIGTASWWVDFEGSTIVGTRETSTPEPGSYELLEYDPINRVATLGANDLSALTIGTILATDERLVESQTIRELRFEIAGDDARVYATCGDSDVLGRIAKALRAIARRAVDDRFYAPLRYRVIRRTGDRVELQGVSPGAPDISPISMSPGLAGGHSDLSLGTIVLVSFVEGLRSMPIVTHFAGKDGTGFVPVNTTIDATTLIKLGANAANFVALANLVKARIDTIQQAFDAHTHIGTATVSTGPVGTIAAPASPIGALDAVAASKVKAE